MCKLSYLVYLIIAHVLVCSCIRQAAAICPNKVSHRPAPKPTSSQTHTEQLA